MVRALCLQGRNVSGSLANHASLTLAFELNDVLAGHLTFDDQSNKSMQNVNGV